MLPFCIPLGFAGFQFEWRVRKPEDISSAKHLPKSTVSEARNQRQLNESVTNKTAENIPDPSSSLDYRGELIFDKNK